MQVTGRTGARFSNKRKARLSQRDYLIGNAHAVLMIKLLCTTCLGLVSGLPIDRAQAQTASSQSEADPGLEEVVVTAQRRKEKLQDVPVTVNAFSASEVKDSVLTTTTDLGVVTPGLVSATQFGYFQPHLRGVGTTAPSASVENPVAVYVDGVYYGVQAGSIFSLAGIDHIEVDKGPQGTLFGRNATGGLIQIITKDPEQAFSGSASVTGGDYSTAGTSLYVSGGITPTVATNLSVYFQDQGEGFGKNYFTDQAVNKTQDLAVRNKILFTPSDDDTILLAFDYEQENASSVLIPAPGTTPFGGPPYTGPRQSADGFFQPRNIEKQGGVSLKVDHDFGFARLESITAYLQSSLYSAFDGSLIVDPTFALNIDLDDLHTQFTQEVDLRSEPDSPITWTAGVFFYDADARYEPVLLTGGYIAPLSAYATYSNSHALSEAVFAQASTEIFDATNLTLGLRYTLEQKSFSESQYGVYPGGPPILFAAANNVPLNSDKPSWRVSIDHKLTPDILVYASYNRGIKSGGFDDQELPVRTYAPETLDAFEVGTKTQTLEHRLQLDGSAFYYDYHNVQTVAYPAGTEVIYSAPSAEIYGIDLDVKAAVFTNFTIAGGLEYLHATYGDFPGAQFSTPAPGGGSILGTFNANGQRMPLAPRGPST